MDEGALNARKNINPSENIFTTLFGEYERVLLNSLIASFGLDFLKDIPAFDNLNSKLATVLGFDLMIKDQDGGEVDTIYNVRETGYFRDSKLQDKYDSLPDYTKQLQHQYHGKDPKYQEINAKNSALKKEGNLIDAYTGKKAARNADIDLDHMIATKEIHEDPGRILADMTVEELANTEWNLYATDRSINRSMQDTDKNVYLKKHVDKTGERIKRIQELKEKETRTDKERKELEKLEKLDAIDADEVIKLNKYAKSEYEKQLADKYYRSPEFIRATAITAIKNGAKMTIREVVGVVLVEYYICARNELISIPAGSSLEDMINAVGRGLKQGYDSINKQYKEVLTKACEGFVTGALSSLTTTMCNVFFTTSKNIVRCIRQIYASVVQAGSELLFNPQNKSLGDRVISTTIILATGAGALLGNTVGDMISKTPIGSSKEMGKTVTVFCSSMISGMLACTFLVFLDRSKFINDLVDRLNSIPSDANNYKEIADMMEVLAAKLADLDVEKFREDTSKFSELADNIMQTDDIAEMNSIMLNAYEKLNIQIPWNGDFDSFMGNRNNKLVFG